MSPTADIPQLDRVRFFNGQRLRADDLADWQARVRALRWLHSRSFHSWGIALRFDVRGDSGDTAVEVSPGFAVDCLGREIILSSDRVVPVPAVAASPSGEDASFYLTASYLGDDNQKVRERRDGVCRPEGTVRLGEEPLLEWRRADQIDEGIDIVLAQAWIRNCQLSRPLSLAARRSARAADQPHIAAGQTPAGQTEWTPWQVNGDVLGLAVEVDTTAARFRSVPRYIAHLAGERVVGETTAGVGESLLVPFCAVSETARDGFRYQVLLPTFHSSQINPPGFRQASGPDLANELGLHVVWLAYAE